MHPGTSGDRRRKAMIWRLTTPLNPPIVHPPPSSGSSPALNVCGGAQRDVSLATGTFTGEARRKPPSALMPEFVSQISNLRNHDRAGVDSRREAREATFGEARWPEATTENQFVRSR